MRQIYHKATRTVVYLGDEADDSSLAIAFLEDIFTRVTQKIVDWEKKGLLLELLDSISRESHRSIAEMKEMRNGDVTDLEEGQKRIDRMKVAQICSKFVGLSKEALFGGFPQEATQKALLALLSRPWFQRVWIIQEFVVAPNVVMCCGRRSVVWESVLSIFCYSFAEAKLRWRDVNPAPRKINFYRGLSQMIKLHGLWNQLHDPEPHRDRLVVLLSKCRTAIATRPVDKIYALLGNSCDSAGFKTVYHNSKARSLLVPRRVANSKGSCKDLLYETARSDQVAGDLPSWVLN